MICNSNSQLSLPFYIIQSDWNDVFVRSKRNDSIWISSKIFGETKRRNYKLLVQNNSIQLDEGIIDFSIVNVTSKCLIIEDKLSKVITRFLPPIKSYASIHSKSITSLDVALNGIAVSSSTDETLKTWDTQAGQLKEQLMGHFLDVNKCRFFPSNEVILSAGSDMQLKIWSAINGSCAATLRGHTGAINDISIVDRGRNIISVGQDGKVKLWNCGKQECIENIFDLSQQDEHENNLRINSCAIRSIEGFDLGQRSDQKHEDAIGTEDKLLLIGTESGFVYGIGVHSKKPVIKVRCNSSVNCVTFNDTHNFAFGTQSGQLYQYNLHRPDEPITCESNSTSPILSIRSVNKPMVGLVIGRQDGTVSYITKEMNQMIHLTGSDCDPIYDIAYDGKFIFTACRDGKAKVYALSCVPLFTAGAVTMLIVFTTAIPKHRCLVNGCDQSGVNNGFEAPYINFTIPIDEKTNQFSKCQQYEGHQSSLSINCSIDQFNQQMVVECDHSETVFDHKYFESTLVTEFNLVCDNSWMIQLVQSAFFSGVLLGAILSGIIADKFGRRAMYFFIPELLLISLISSTFVPNMFVYGVLAVLKGICVSGVYQPAFVIGIELLGGRWRFWLGNVHSIIFAFGSFIICLIAQYYRNWRPLEYSLTIPAIIMIIFPYLFPESIRWQVSNGRSECAVKQLRGAYETNGVKIDEELFQQILNHENEKNLRKRIQTQQKPTANVWDLFRHSTLRIWTLSLLYIWFTNSLVYYGLSFLSSQFDDDVYYSLKMMCIVELPGIVLTTYAVEKMSRKRVLMSVMLIGGIACTISSLLPETYGGLKLALAIFGKMNISGSFSLIFVYTVEIFPTVLRISGLGLCSVFARIGGMVAPYVLQLEMFGPKFPFLAIGITSLIAGVVSVVLPETKDKKLPDTIEEVSLLIAPTKNNNNNNKTADYSSTSVTRTNDMLLTGRTSNSDSP